MLVTLQQEMLRLGLWEEQAPEAQALSSTVPFCADSLELHQWLRWVFVPRMHALIDLGGQLPDNCAISPMAEMSWPGQPDRDPLIRLLAELDLCLQRKDTD